MFARALYGLLVFEVVWVYFVSLGGFRGLIVGSVDFGCLVGMMFDCV